MFKIVVFAAVWDSGIDLSQVVGIVIDFIVFILLLVLRDGTLLCWVEGFEECLYAMFKLWKHHAV